MFIHTRNRAYVKYNGRFYPLFDGIVKYIIKNLAKNVSKWVQGYGYCQKK